jgi:hypothetical protein
MIDQWLEQFEQLRRAGAIVLLKWDGQRTADPYTVVVTRADSDFIFRRDTADFVSAIRDGIAAYREAHPDAAE